jgi:hypothetical protein
MASGLGRFRVKPCAEYGGEFATAKPGMAENRQTSTKKSHFVAKSSNFFT